MTSKFDMIDALLLGARLRKIAAFLRRPDQPSLLAQTYAAELDAIVHYIEQRTAPDVFAPPEAKD